MPISEPLWPLIITMDEITLLKPEQVRTYAIMKRIDGKLHVKSGGKSFRIEAQAKKMVMRNFMTWLKAKCGRFSYQKGVYKTMPNNFLIMRS